MLNRAVKRTLCPMVARNGVYTMHRFHGGHQNHTHSHDHNGGTCDHSHDHAQHHQHHHHNPTAAESATTQTVLQAINSDSTAHQIMPASRLPVDFVENTFIPHLEHALIHQSVTFTPYDLQRVVVAYSQMPVRQKAIETIIGERTMENLRYMEPWNVVGMLSALRITQPDNNKLWIGMCNKITSQLSEYSTLNLVAIFRVIGRYQEELPEASELLEKVTARLNEELPQFEGEEFSEMLRVIADHAAQGDTRQDRMLVQLFLPHIEAKYNQTSIIHALEILWSLVRMKVLPLRYLKMFEADLTETRLLGMPPKHLALLCWVFHMMDREAWLFPKVKPVLESVADAITAADFARLSMALPASREKDILMLRVCANLAPRVADMDRNEVLLFFNAVVNSDILPTPMEIEAGLDGDNKGQTEFETDAPLAQQPASPADSSSESAQAELEINVDRKAIFESILGYFHADKDLFTAGEIKRVTMLLTRTPKYRAFLEDLPQEWQAHHFKEIDRNRDSLLSRVLGGTSKNKTL